MISDIEKAYFFTSGPLFFITLLGVLSSRKVFFCMKFKKFTQAKTLWWHFFKRWNPGFLPVQNCFGGKMTLEEKQCSAEVWSINFMLPKKLPKCSCDYTGVRKTAKKHVFSVRFSIMWKYVVKFGLIIIIYFRVKKTLFRYQWENMCFFKEKLFSQNI